MLIETDDYLTTTEAARLLRVAPSRVVQLCSDGALPCLRQRSGWRLIDRRDLRAFAKARYTAVLERYADLLAEDD